jgi:hypothetical protein
MERQALCGRRKSHAMVMAPGMVMRISLVSICLHFVAVACPMGGIGRLGSDDWRERFERVRGRLSARRNSEQEAKEKRDQLMHDAYLPD